MYRRFSSLDKVGKGYLAREDFLRIPELAINPLGDRIVHAFFFESKVGAIFAAKLLYELVLYSLNKSVNQECNLFFCPKLYFVVITVSVITIK